VKQFVYKWILFCAACLLLFPVHSLAIIEENQITAVDQLRVLLVADDGFDSLQNSDKIPITDLLTIVIRAAEAQGISVQLQGATSNNNRSSLQYSTDSGDAVIDWSKIPRKGNEDILSSSISRLREGKDDNAHTRIMVITGRVPDRKLKIQRIANLALTSQTILTQLVPFSDGTNLTDDYSALLGMNLADEGIDVCGYSIYSATQNGISIPIRSKYTDGYLPEQLLRDLLLEGVFTDGYSLEGSSFGIPADYLDGAMILVKGKNVSEMMVKSPDGSVYRAAYAARDVNAPSFQLLQMGDQQVMLISFTNALREGVWYLENDMGWDTAEYFYSLAEDYSEKLQKAEIVDSEKWIDQFPKGEQEFIASQEVNTRSLFRLYPNLRLKVTDTFASEIVEEALADEETRDRILLHFSRGGEHQLTFRLMDDEKEICRRTVSVIVKDQKITFEEQKPILIYYDAVNNDNVLDATMFFKDPDGDEIKVNREDTGVVIIKDNILALQLPPDAEDGSEVVPLRGTADEVSVKGSIEVHWKSLKKMMEKLDIDCQIIHEDENNGNFAKRQLVHIQGQIKQLEELTDTILEQLDGARIQVVDSNGEFVAEGSFDSEKGTITSDAFRLPDVSGEYVWTIQSNSDVNTIPAWKHEIKTNQIQITNHPPVLNQERIPSDSFGEKYVFDLTDWQFNLPEQLFTDPEGDPIDIYVKINDGEPQAVALDGDSITLPEYGKYTIEIYAFDNEKQQSEESIKETVSLFDKQEIISELEGTYRIEVDRGNGFYRPATEMEIFYKRQQVKMLLGLNINEWTEEKLTAMKSWLSSQLLVLISDEEDAPINAEFDPESMTLSANITLPDAQKEIKYHFAALDPNDRSLLKAFNTNELSITSTNQLPVWRESIPASFDKWVMRAEEYDAVVISDDMAGDPDGEEIKYSVSLFRVMKDGSLSENLLHDTGNLDLPYQVVFPAFETFSLEEKYIVRPMVTDSEQASIDMDITVTLHNKTLLFIILAVAAVLFILILILVIHLIHRKNLPAFRGEIVFVFRDQEVSQHIDLAPWYKQQHVPLADFSGSISILLTNKQWEKMNQLELRPDKNSGYILCNGSQKKARREELPYMIDDTLKILNPSDSTLYSSRT